MGDIRLTIFDCAMLSTFVDNSSVERIRDNSIESITNIFLVTDFHHFDDYNDFNGR